jgi:pyrroline-5-carboxylate reductase
MELGFIGTGTITAAIVTGLGTSFGATGHIHLSPRSPPVAAALAERFAHVQVAASNQDVLDRSDVVVLAVRPQIATAVIEALQFRPDHHVISLIATYPANALAPLIAPASRLSKAVPLPAAALGHSATAIYPPDPVAAALFNAVGTAIEVDSPAQFDALTAATATMASYFTFADTVATWLTTHGVPAANARRYVASLFEGLALSTQATPAPDFTALAIDHATKGGINEELAQRLTQSGAFAGLESGLDAILARIQAPLQPTTHPQGLKVHDAKSL